MESSFELKREEEITNEIDKSCIREKIPMQELLDEVILKEIIENLKKLKEKYTKEIEKKK